jgi:uncharacterized protein YkwD
MRFLLLALALMTTFTSTTDAGIFRQRTRTRTTAQATVCQPGQSCYQVATTVTQTTTTATNDPLYAVNALRASYGLRALAYDATLAAHAAVNNAHQRIRGLGHWSNPNAYQVSSSAGDPNGAVATWMASSAHRSIVLNPSLTVAGIAHGSGFSTMNLR